LSGIVTSSQAAFDGNASLAVSNAFGGIAAQTVFLVLVDFAYPHTNLEHAAASIHNMFHSALLAALLSAAVLACFGPEVSVLHLHPMSLILPALRFLGVRVAHQSERIPMWRPVRTPQTQEDSDGRDVYPGRKTSTLVAHALVAAGSVAVAGAVIGGSGAVLGERLGLSQSAAGSYLTAIPTSLPELVTAVAAARMGSLNLAMADIIGGNCFDVLFVAVADAFYLEGSIYHHTEDAVLFTAAVALLLNAILMIGLLRREQRGPANVGMETIGMLVVYVGSALLLALH
jgi:cation:H+ antiporter